MTRCGPRCGPTWKPWAGRRVNPFSIAYTQAEIAAYGAPLARTVGDVEFGWLNGRADRDTEDYLNWPMIARRPLRYPALCVRGKVWMSLVPREVQSCYVPIRAAHGIVGTAGLGLGYVPLRMAAKRTVKRVHVFEVEEDVIRWFRGAFVGRPELDKITVEHGDVRALMVGRRFDLVWMDPYDTFVHPRVEEDARHFRARNSIGAYLFWYLERVVLDALQMGEVIPETTAHERAFLRRWRHTRHELFADRLPTFWTPRVLPDRQRAIFDAIGRPWHAGMPFNPGTLSPTQIDLLARFLENLRAADDRAVEHI